MDLFNGIILVSIGIGIGILIRRMSHTDAGLSGELESMGERMEKLLDDRNSLKRQRDELLAQQKAIREIMNGVNQ